MSSRIVAHPHKPCAVCARVCETDFSNYNLFNINEIVSICIYREGSVRDGIFVNFPIELCYFINVFFRKNYFEIEVLIQNRSKNVPLVSVH